MEVAEIVNLINKHADKKNKFKGSFHLISVLLFFNALQRGKAEIITRDLWRNFFQSIKNCCIIKKLTKQIS